MIDYELKITGRKNLTWIGHSQGTSQMFAALSSNQQKYVDKINLFVALAPIARLTNVMEILEHNKQKLPPILKFAIENGIEELFGPSNYNLDGPLCAFFNYGCH